MSKKLRIVKTSIGINMCRCGKVRLTDKPWKTITIPFDQFIRNVTSEHVRSIIFRYELCGTC
jgi:hypothetical protein